MPANRPLQRWAHAAPSAADAPEAQRVGEAQRRVAVDAGPAAPSAGHAGQAEPERVRSRRSAPPSRGPRRAACAKRARWRSVPPARDQLQAGRRAAGRAARVQLDGGRVGVAGPRRVGDQRPARRTRFGIADLRARRARGNATAPATPPMTRPAPDARARGRRDAANLVIVPAEYSHEPSMQNWDRPPPDIAVAELFERWLPEAFAAAGQRAPAGAPMVRVSISGAGGGTWEVRADGASLSVAPRGTRAARHLDSPVGRRPARRAGRARRGSARRCCRPEWSARDLLFADPRDVDLVRQISGRLRSRSRGGGGGAGRWTSASARRASARAPAHDRCASTARRSRACARERSRRCRRCSTDG